MRSILDYIKVFKNIETYKDPKLRHAKAEFSPVFDPDLEQSEFLRPGETLEDWKPNPFLKPHAEGGRIGFDPGGTVKKATGPTKKNTGSTSPVKTDTHIYKRTNRWGTVWSDTPSKTAEGWVKRKAHALDPKNIDDIRANLIKNKKKVTMVNNQFIFADEKLQQQFLDDMLLRYKYPKTSTKAVQAGYLTNEQIFKKYFEGTYKQKGVHDLIFRFKRKLGLDFSKLPPGERNAHQLRRQAKELISQAGKRISGLDDFPAHHLYPVGDEFAHGTQDFTIIDKKTNSQLSGSNKQLIGLSEQRTQLVNDVSSGNISSKNFNIEMGKLDNQAQTIIDGHYKKFPKHDGLLNWRKATSVLDDQGRFMDIQSTGSIGGDSSKWAITDVNKQIKDLSKTELATFRGVIKKKSQAQLLKQKDLGSQKLYSFPANLAKNSKFGKLGKGIKLVAKGEALFAPLFLYGGAAYGLPFTRNINEASYGILGKSKSEYLINKSPKAKKVIDLLDAEAKYNTLLENYNNGSAMDKMWFKDKMLAKQKEFEEKVAAFNAIPEEEKMELGQAYQTAEQNYEDEIKQRRDRHFSNYIIPKKEFFTDIGSNISDAFTAPVSASENVFGTPILTGKVQTEFAKGGIADLTRTVAPDSEGIMSLKKKKW